MGSVILSLRLVLAGHDYRNLEVITRDSLVSLSIIAKEQRDERALEPLFLLERSVFLGSEIIFLRRFPRNALPDRNLFLESRPPNRGWRYVFLEITAFQLLHQTINYRVHTGKMALARNLAEFPGDPPVENQRKFQLSSSK